MNFDEPIFPIYGSFVIKFVLDYHPQILVFFYTIFSNYLAAIIISIIYYIKVQLELPGAEWAQPSK